MAFTSANIITIVAIIGLLITAGTVVGGSFRVSRNTATVTRYKEAADSWEAKARAQDERLGAQEERIATLEAEVVTKDTQIGELTGKLAVLQEVVTGRTMLEELVRDQAEFARAYDSRSSEILSQIGSVRGESRAIHERLDAMSAQLEEVAYGRQSPRTPPRKRPAT